jgi:hypothetical protein
MTPSLLPTLRASAISILLLLASREGRGQAVLGPTEDATVAPAGAMRFRIGNSWTSYYQTLGGPDTVASTYNQVRLTNISAEFGITSRLSATFVMPEAGTLATTEWSSLNAGTLRVDSIVKSSHNGIGDLEIAAKYSWLAGPSELERIALPDGLHLRSSLSASYRFATGIAPDPNDQFGVATGSGRTAVTAASQTDIMFGHIFWISAVARYVWPGAVTRDLRVYGPINTGYTLNEINETGGNLYELQATPRVVLGRYFSIGGQYIYAHRDASTYTATGPDTLNVAALGAKTAGTVQYLSGSVTYSTVAAYIQGKNGLPVEISYTHTGTLSSSGDVPPGAATDVVTIRLWARLWGSAWKWKRVKP